jgi:hypothetical protein
MGEVRAAERPWTVVVLVLWGIAGTLWTFFFSDWVASQLLLELAFAAIVTWAYWMAHRWVFVLTYAGVILSGIGWAIFVFSGSTRIDARGKVLWFITIVAMLYLLRHQATRRFIDPDWDRPREVTGPPDRGGRAAQASAIALFGVLAVGVPILWTIGMLEGPLLMAAVVACLGSGLAVLFLSSPAKREGLPPSSEIA